MFDYMFDAPQECIEFPLNITAEIIDPLTDAEAGRLFKALIAHWIITIGQGEIPEEMDAELRGIIATKAPENFGEILDTIFAPEYH